MEEWLQGLGAVGSGEQGFTGGRVSAWEDGQVPETDNGDDYTL